MKFIFFVYADYIKVALQALTSDKNVLLLPHKNLRFLQKVLLRIRMKPACTVLKKLLPFSLFRMLYDPDRQLKTKEEHVFVMYEQHPLAMDICFLERLRKKYKLAKVVYIFTNTLASGVNKEHLEYVLLHRSKFDLILTFNEPDAAKYGFEFYEQIFSPVYTKDPALSMSQVCFCGLDKGRRQLLVALESRFKANGIESDISIATPDKFIPYEMVLQKSAQTDCILEILADISQPGSSIRVAEAIANGKKLLTNNPFIKSKPYFNPLQISYFSSAEDVDLDFIKNHLDENKKINPDEVSPGRFLLYIKSKLFIEPINH